MTSKYLITGALATVLLVGGVALAGDDTYSNEKRQWSEEKRTEKLERRVKHLASELKLSKEQELKIRKVMQSNSDRIKLQKQSNREKMAAELKIILSAAQLEKYDLIKRKRHGKRGSKE